MYHSLLGVTKPYPTVCSDSFDSVTVKKAMQKSKFRIRVIDEITLSGKRLILCDFLKILIKIDSLCIGI
jgi:hypothetical protein